MTNTINPFLITDGYKLGHHKMYPQGTTLVYSNFTPRSNRHAPNGVDYVISFGQQMVMKQIHEYFQDGFFNRPKDEVVEEIKREISLFLGQDYDVKHIEELHDLGYLPIKVKSLPEGIRVPIGVPVLTIYNTKPEQFWLTNFLETIISNLLWKPITSATIASQYKKILVEAAMKTDDDNLASVQFQAHDFSMRGMDSVEAVISSGLGHLTSFDGSDSLPVLHGARKYYGETGFVAGGVNATEHSVMSAGGSKDGEEIETFRYLMKQFPTGILSIVSDTWNLWTVLTEYMKILKDDILQRDGKIVIRPDSGNPVDIICGIDSRPVYRKLYMKDGQKAYNDENETDFSDSEFKGVVELLWDTFGGTINKQGYKVLNPHIGAIYGDSITLERSQQIVDRLKAKGFASTNVVLGIGSYTYQYNTRDSFGFAMKATYVEIKSKKMDAHGKSFGRNIFKDPITDDGRKKSAKGLLYVWTDSDGKLIVRDQVEWTVEQTGLLKTIYLDGNITNPVTLTEIKKRVSK